MPGFFAISLSLGLLFAGACASQDVKLESYPAPPNIGTSRDQQTLGRLTRDAVTEINPSRRVEKLLELRSHARAMASKASTLDRQGDDLYDEEIAPFIVETAYVAVVNGDYKRGGWPSVDETVLREHLPKELVALRITEPRHWIDALYPKMVSSGSIAAVMARDAGAFEVFGTPFPRFSHLGRTLGFEHKASVIESDEFDGLIRELFFPHRFAALLWLLQIEKGLMREAALEEYLALRRELLAVEAHLDDVLTRYQRLRAQQPGPPAPFPYGEQSQEMLRRLAERPEWSVHLYVLAVMNQGGRLWRDEEVVKRVAAHNNPVSMRFLARYGLTKPAVPEAQPPNEKN